MAATSSIRSDSSPRYDRLPADAPVGEACREFRRLHYPTVEDGHWNDWRWQLRNRLSTVAQLGRVFELSDDESEALGRRDGQLPVAITPYYAHILAGAGDGQALRCTHLPALAEQLISAGESADPLEEDAHSPVAGVVHKYPDRVLFLATGSCATYCRYCTRSRIVGNAGGEHSFSVETWEAGLEYIRSNAIVRDVLISGGDPLLLSTNKLAWLLAKLRAVPHVEFIRLGTKIPLVLPQRVTAELAALLRQDKPVWISLHATHPAEITTEARRALATLADAGLPLGSQTVLLKGVNDDAATMRRLVHRLLECRVRPYYLYQCDPIAGSAHFRTPLDVGPRLVTELRRQTTGYAVPTFVVDTPTGKVAVGNAQAAISEGEMLALSGDQTLYVDG
ncbi:MAG: KamA family radical SAM protein [Devosia sp.]